MKIGTTVYFCASHFLPTHERCQRLHGHNYKVDAIITGTLIHGMVIDFVKLKKLLSFITEKLDHKLLVPTEHSDVLIIDTDTQYNITYDGYLLSIPKNFIKLLSIPHTTAEHIAKYIQVKLQKQLPTHHVQITVWENHTSFAQTGEKNT